MAVVVRLAGTFRVHAAGAQNIAAGNNGAGNNGVATEHVIGSRKARGCSRCWPPAASR